MRNGCLQHKMKNAQKRKTIKQHTKNIEKGFNSMRRTFFFFNEKKERYKLRTNKRVITSSGKWFDAIVL